MPDEPASPPAPAARRDPRGWERRCLRLRGLPFGATEEQVALFLSPCATVELAVVCRQDGRCTGHAFAVCATPEQAQRAFLTLNKRYLGHRYVEVFNALPQEVDAAAAGAIEYDVAARRRSDGGRARATAVTARPAAGPSSAGGETPAGGSPVAALAGSGSGAGGSSSGAVAGLPQLSEASLSASSRQSSPRSLRSSELFPHLGSHTSSQAAQEQDSAAAGGAERPVVRLTGVPFGTQPKALLTWLEPAVALGGLRGVHYVLNESGFFTGEAFVELIDAVSLEAALSKDGHTMQDKTVRAEASSLAAVRQRFGALRILPPASQPPPPRRPPRSIQGSHGGGSSGGGTPTGSGSSGSSGRGRGPLRNSGQQGGSGGRPSAAWGIDGAAALAAGMSGLSVVPTASGSLQQPPPSFVVGWNPMPAGQSPAQVGLSAVSTTPAAWPSQQQQYVLHPQQQQQQQQQQQPVMTSSQLACPQADAVPIGLAYGVQTESQQQDLALLLGAIPGGSPYPGNTFGSPGGQ